MNLEADSTQGHIPVRILLFGAVRSRCNAPWRPAGTTFGGPR